MKKIYFFCLAALMFIPAFGISAVPSNNNQMNSFLVAENGKAELQPAESKESEEKAENPEEKKESKVGFFAGVLVIGLLTIYFLVKTKKITDN